MKRPWPRRGWWCLWPRPTSSAIPLSKYKKLDQLTVELLLSVR